MPPRAKSPPKSDPNLLGPACRVVVLAGKEAFIRDQHTRNLRKAIEATGVQVDVIRFEGATASAADVFDECRSFGLMGQHKLVVVDNADQFVKEDNRPLVERYAQSPSDSATLVLRTDIWRAGKLDKMIAAVGGILACEAPSIPAATKAAVKRAQETYQRILEPDAAETLVARIGPDMGRIDAELAKLAATTQPQEPVTAELVRSMVVMAREEKAWVIADYLLYPNPEQALLKLRELIEVSRLDPVPIRWAYVDTARKLHAVAVEVSQGTPPYAAGKSLRLWGPSAEHIRRVGAKVPVARLAELLTACVEADFRGKTGQGDPLRTLEVLTLQFAEVARA